MNLVTSKPAEQRSPSKPPLGITFRIPKVARGRTIADPPIARCGQRHLPCRYFLEGTFWRGIRGSSRETAPHNQPLRAPLRHIVESLGVERYCGGAVLRIKLSQNMFDMGFNRPGRY